MISLRTCTPDDAKALVEIYAPYVEKTAITFEYDVPSVEEFRSRIENTLKKYPYIVAEDDGKIIGYAYAGTFKGRRAYDHCAEISIYVAEEQHGKGVGRMLYAELEKLLEAKGIINICACITWIDKPNSHLTQQSPRFHEKLGYKTVAHFHRCGYKFGEWYDMIWMEKILPAKSLWEK
jgi:phosphinothricin acetyltransferase